MPTFSFHPLRIMISPTILAAVLLATALLPAAATSQETDTPTGAAAESDSLAPCPSIPRLAIVGGLTAGGFIYGHVILSNLWWKGEQSPFHFDWDHDWNYSLGADKVGHAYFPYLVTNVYRQALEWGGLDTATSLYVAASGALAYQTYIEVRDGFSKQWGFSWGDWGADLVGAALPVVQHHVPALRGVDVKISFNPSDKFKAGMYNAIIDDYESTYHWISINVHDLLPAEWQRWYPRFVNLAIGHSVKDLDGAGGGHHELYLSLDWNLKALPGDGWLLKLLKRNLDFYHLPAPAVRITPGVVWYGLRF
jgi:hypothetical protein